MQFSEKLIFLMNITQTSNKELMHLHLPPL